MTLYLRRLLESIFVIFLASFMIYMLIGLMPGDPIDLMAAGNPHITPEDAQRLRAIYGLDQPLVTRYGHWLSAALAGDLGYSRLYHLPVLEIIAPRLLNTILLMGSALLLTVLLAVPLGVLAARFPFSGKDKLIGFFSLAGMSAPPFWIALLLISLFSVNLRWLPAAVQTEGDIATKTMSMILPLLTLTFAGLAVYTRHTRSAMLETLKSPYIQTARAKGCTESRVIWRHAFRNAAAPLMTIFMLDLGTLASGAVTIETIFAYPGMGKLMFDAIMGNDYNLALAGLLLLTILVVLANFLADVSYGLIDPRARQRGREGKE